MARTLDRFELMRLLVRIAETGSLSAAGRSLGLSQPSASRQLRALESELGAQLIMRTTHELSFTEAGEEFLNEARQLIAGWDAAVEKAGGGSEHLKGKIRVAASSGLGQTTLADLAGSFVSKHSAVSFEWLVIDDPGDMVAEGFDLWIRVGPIKDESLFVRCIWSIERAVVSARKEDHEIMHPKDLAGHSAVVLGPYVGSRLDLTHVEEGTFCLEPEVCINTDNLFVAERLTLAGHGYSILPLWLIEEPLDAGKLEIVCQGWTPPPLTLSMAYPHTRFRPARVRAFADHLRDELPIIGRGIVSPS